MVKRILCCCGRILLSSNKRILSSEALIKEDCLPLHPKKLPPLDQGVWSAAGVLLSPRLLPSNAV